jgi:hypothetical protein
MRRASWPASCSRRVEGHVEEFGRRFPLLEPLGNDAKGQGLYSGDGFITVLAVAEYPRKGGHFGNPAAVVLAFKLDGERHDCTVPSGPAVS